MGCEENLGRQHYHQCKDGRDIFKGRGRNTEDTYLSSLDALSHGKESLAFFRSKVPPTLENYRTFSYDSNFDCMYPKS